MGATKLCKHLFDVDTSVFSAFDSPWEDSGFGWVCLVNFSSFKNLSTFCAVAGNSHRYEHSTGKQQEIWTIKGHQG